MSYLTHYSLRRIPFKCVPEITRWLSTSPPEKKREWPKRIFSGIQPTGTLHLGNYFGAVHKWLELQNNDEDLIISIVDLHSISLPQEPKVLQQSILLMTASLMACGIDPAKCILFQQSQVAEHTLLYWVLGSLTTLPRLYHFPQYKEKSSQMKEVPFGLFAYPVLQAADILLYKSTHVPVGEDQVQHLHLAQHLVHTFNNRFSETFPVPEILVQSGMGGGGRVRSLREPDKKMSKSHLDPKSRIDLTDSPDQILSKVKKAVTDFTSALTYEPDSRPGVSNLIAIHSLITGESHEQICSQHSHLDTGKYKLVLADIIISKLSPIRDEIQHLMNSPEYLMDVLEEGSRQASTLAQLTWAEVSRKIGFYKHVKRKRSADETARIPIR